MNHIEATLARKDDATSIAFRAALTALRTEAAVASMGYGFAAAVACAAATDAEARVTEAYVAYVTFGDAPPAGLLPGVDAAPASAGRTTLKGATKGATRRRVARWHAAIRFCVGATQPG